MRRQRDIIEVIDQHERDLRRLKAALARKPKALENLANYLPLTGGELSGGLKVDEATVDDGQLRLTYTGDPNSVIFRNDGSNFWALISDTEDGSWNTLRPFQFSLTSGMVYMANGATVADGTVSAPGIRLSSNAHGLYRYDASNIGIAANGAAAILASSGGVTVMGSYLYFNGVTGTEYLEFNDGANYARFVLDGGERARINTSGQILAGAGTENLPGWSFIVDPNTGMYRGAENILSFATGGANRGYFQNGSTSSNAGTKWGGTLLVNVSNKTLGSTASSMIHAQSWAFDVGANNVGFEVQALRDATGSDWTTAAVGIRRVTDSTPQASIWWYQSRIGINMSGPMHTLHVAGTFGARPATTTISGNIAHWHIASGSDYGLYRYTSARKNKTDINYDTDNLADINLKPVTFRSLLEADDPDAVNIGFIADDIADEDKRAAVFDEDGEVEVYRDAAVMSILAAKANRAEAEIKALEERVRVLESA